MDLYRWEMDDMMSLNGVVCGESEERARDIVYQYLSSKGYSSREILNNLYITWLGSMSEQIWLLDV